MERRLDLEDDFVPDLDLPQNLNMRWRYIKKDALVELYVSIDKNGHHIKSSTSWYVSRNLARRPEIELIEELEGRAPEDVSEQEYNLLLLKYSNIK